MQFDDLVAEFERPKRVGNGKYIAACPVSGHGQGKGDRHPSLSITDGGLQALIHCQVGCETDSVLSALGLTFRDLYYDAMPFGNGNGTGGAPVRRSVDTGGLAEQIAFVEGVPTSLPNRSVTALPLAMELIPEPLRPWLCDIAERMQCPVDYPAAAAIVAASAMIGNKIAIRPKVNDSWLVVPNLYGAIVGLPGSMKSPAVNEALKPLFEIAKTERQKHENEMIAFGASKEAAEVEKKKAKELYRVGKIEKDSFISQFQDCEVEPPTERRVFTSDATVEKLGELLNQNPNGILQLRDELTGWLRGLDRAGHEQDRAFYLEAWNGTGAFAFDRIARGTVHIQNLTLSIFGSIQPAMIGPYLRSVCETDGADGLPQRFQLLVYPEPSKSYQYVDRKPVGNDEVQALYRYLWELNPETIGAFRMGEQAFVSFDSSAQAFFQEWFIDLETTLRSDVIEDPAILSHLSKYRSLMPSLALIFHLLEGRTGAVSLDSAMRAAGWCSYLKSHAEKLYSLRGTVFDTARLILKRIAKGDLGDTFTSRDVYRAGWSGLTKTEDVNAALAVLVEYGYLFAMKIETGGRGSTQFTVHISITKRGAK